MAFSDSQLQDLKERADLAHLVGRRVELRRAGKDLVGLCPFHGERTPSFYVVPDKHFWNCFGCGENGDAFKFFMKLDGLTFTEAVQHVAHESGVILVDEKHDPEEARRRAHLDALAELLERAVRFYEHRLWGDAGEPVRAYLRSRGVQDEWVRRFRLGFGGAGRDDLSRALVKANASVDLAVEAGLCLRARSDNAPYDRFQGRLIVPIRVPRPPDGRTVGLGGRVLEGLTPVWGDRKPAKYVNSPETPLYQKSHVLFGLDVARDAIRRAGRAVVVEGYFDVVGLHQAGLGLAVASCGTSITPQHLELLTRTGAKEVVFLFDGDAAGLRAAAKAAEFAAKSQVPARVATLPDGLDPDDFARRRGLEGLEALLERARPAVDVLLDAALGQAGPGAPVEERVRAVQSVRGVVQAAPDTLSRELYVGQIADRLRVSEQSVRDALSDLPPASRAPRASSAPPEPPPPSGDGFEPPPDLAAGGEAPRRWKGRRPKGPEGPSSLPGFVRTPPRAPTAAFEESIALALLKHPALSSVVAQEGVLGMFASPVLRALGEHVVACAQEHVDVDPAAVVGAIEDPALRGSLLAQLAEADVSLEDSFAHLQRVLVKMRQTIVRLERQRQLAQSGYGPADAGAEEAMRAEAERAQAGLQELRRLHQRLNELRRPAAS